MYIRRGKKGKRQIFDRNPQGGANKVPKKRLVKVNIEEASLGWKRRQLKPIECNGEICCDPMLHQE